MESYVKNPRTIARALAAVMFLAALGCERKPALSVEVLPGAGGIASKPFDPVTVEGDGNDEGDGQIRRKPAAK